MKSSLSHGRTKHLSWPWLSNMKTAAQQSQLQQFVEELCGASIRAATSAAGFRFRGREAVIDERSAGIRAPHLYPQLDSDTFRSFRGAADGITQRIKHSDSALHRSLMPSTETGKLLFELLEQLRVESLVDRDKYPGCAANLDYRYKAWCAQFCDSGLTESHVGLLVYTIAQVAWSRLSGQPVNEATEGLIEPQRMMLAPHIGGYLAGMRRAREDQHAYAQNALGIVAVINELTEALSKADKTPQDDGDDTLTSGSMTLFPETDDQGLLPGLRSHAHSASFEMLQTQLSDYKIYSNARDRVIEATKLVLPHQRESLREQLDETIRGQRVNIPRLARQLRALLSASEHNHWADAQEEGYLDSAQINRIVTAPSYRAVFKQEHAKPHSDCVVSFLIDNSGSMKEHIQPIAAFIEVLCRALALADIKSEVLGFTTRSWQGGASFKAWRRAGGTPNPGRLAELEHIIYKDADTDIRRARSALAAMLKPSIFKESVNGEALLWATERLMARPEKRRILIVLSDGCPMETATVQNNPDDFLDTHLAMVAALLEKHPNIALFGLGFGLDLSRYYRHSLALDLPHPLENSVFNEFLRLLATQR
ncbi:cobaltochelatase CobT-related protein [Neptunomonas marina]|uniref:Cobalamin biosynthesis protein CobT n=1 Tax=Neptunomonas marina TaxID=1815562 RepID=A0A437QEE4_9GAMM|nr:cobalamin biosynthesis protein CobT [Neptunomonas marina]RVU32763.1 cobalamin biosynthesis protein CobT [Neptunomonas marina]